MSESEDAMSYESQPQTPTSPGDYQPSFSAEITSSDASAPVVKGRCASSGNGQQGASSWELRGEEPRAKEPLKPSSSLPDVVQGFSRYEDFFDSFTVGWRAF